MKNFLIFVGIVIVLGGGGYIAYRVIWKGEDLGDVTDDTISDISDATKAGPLGKASMAYAKQDFEEAVKQYRQALQLTGADAIDASERKACYQRIAECYYKMCTAATYASKGGAWKRARSQDGIAAFKDFIQKYPNDSKVGPMRDKIRELQSLFP